MMDTLLYSLLYRSLNSQSLVQTKPSAEPVEDPGIMGVIDEVLRELEAAEIKRPQTFTFNDVQYVESPLFDNETGRIIRVSYRPILVNNMLKGKPEEYVKRFENTTKADFPLINVAEQMGITVEIKRNTGHDSIAYYSPGENKIVMGTDDKTVFLHELAHGIDHYLDIYDDDKASCEVVAELSSLVLCKLNNVVMNFEWSKGYLGMFCYDAHYTLSTIPDTIIKRVAAICALTEKTKREAL
jgi:hypothetical protein